MTWPAAGAATVDLAVDAATARGSVARDRRVKAEALPVWVASSPTPAGEDVLRGSGAPAAIVDRVRVEVADRAEAARAGVSGIVLKVSRADGVRRSGAVTVQVDYSGFAGAYGGDWASRLRLVTLPDGRPLVTENDLSADTLSAVVSLPADGSAIALAVAGAASGDNGDYTATSLTPASTWQVSQQTGAFTWSYPLRVVPGVGGPEPALALSYSASSVDGRTGGTNTQGSWIGDGWDLWPGYVERTYKSCADDKEEMRGGTPNNTSVQSWDLCWLKPAGNATISLNGRATELVKSSGDTWKGVADDGSKIELLKNTAFDNGDDDGEYWKVTTTDGTQYFFGRNHGEGGASASTASNSVWTVPVYGNHPDEPGYQAGNYAGSRETQGWRWNLDYVVDPHGNTMRYFYTREGGAYGREGDPNKRTTYHRGGYLTRAEYGSRSDASSSTQPAARVLFDEDERCASNCWSGTNPVEASWPDTPWSLYCKEAPCTEQLSPTFWTQKRLSRIRAQVYSGSGTTFNEVEWWTLRHTYLQSGTEEGEPMWLAGITRTGKVTTAGGSEVSDPEVVFDPGTEALPNRVDAMADGRPNLFRYRINTITTESGAQIAVTYSSPQCTRSALPPVDNNGKRCFPQYYAPAGEEPTLDWFHKYVVTRVDVYDNTGGFSHEQTHYDYLDNPAWRYDDSELIEEKKRTWGQFRGYGEVRVRRGLEAGVQSATEYHYLRGMDGDKRKPSGTKDVWVTDSQGRQVEDHEAFAGMPLEEKTTLGPDGALISGTINTPVLQGPTATSGPLKAWMTNLGTVRTRVPLSDGTTRWTKTVTTFNDDNLPVQVDDLGDESTADDDRCTRTWYARNSTTWMLDRPRKIEKVGVNCDATAAVPADVISGTRITYDQEANNWDSYLPVKGDVVKVEEIDRWEATTPVWITTARSTFDPNGRVTAAYDALGRSTTTAYTPTTAGPVTSTTATNSLGHTATTTYATAWHLPTVTIDNVNGFRTDQTYDGFGRLLRVWRPGRAKTSYPTKPSLEFAYLVRNNAPSAVTTKTLTGSDNNAYATVVTLYDGLLRARQVQTQASGGGRTLADTVYDSRGLVAWTSKPYYDTTHASPNTTLVAGPGIDIPAVTENVYDGAGRITDAIFKVRGIEQWRTTTSYGGDRTIVTPPDGGTKTETVADARGRTAQLRQYHSHTAATFDTIAYGHNDRDELTSVVDAAGNTWRYEYDQRGRKIRDEDPDRGVTTYDYDEASQLTSTIDARGVTLAYTYDGLGRKTSLRDGSVTGAKRAEWIYDTLSRGVGKLTKSVRYEPPGSTNQYVNEITEYDTGGRPTKTKVTIPASEGTLCAAEGTTTPCMYSYETGYRPSGDVADVTIPAAGGLGSEELEIAYNEVGLVDSLWSNLSVIYATNSYNKLGLLSQRILNRTLSAGKRTWVTYTYDPHTGRLTNANAVPEAKPEVFNLTYTYKPSGDVIRIDDAPAGGPRDTQCYAYDYARRLTEAWTPESNDCDVARSVDDLGGPAPYWHSYEYAGPPGKAGSRTKETWHGPTNTVRTYHYPAQSGAAGTRPHTVDQVIETTGAVTKTETYTYNETGDTVTRPGGASGQTLTWNEEGRLADAVDSTGTTSYVYDADGNRLIRRDPTGSTLYLPQGVEIRAPSGGTASATRYYSSAGAVVATRTVTGLQWLLSDHHGTAEAAISDTDLTVARRRTHPFGNTRGNVTGVWPAAMDKGFVGGTVDNTGLTHLGAREYDPGIGRFVSVDPVMDLTSPQQMHGYSYANNSPVTLSDPAGLDPGGGQCADNGGCSPTWGQVGDGKPAPKPPGGSGGNKNGGGGGKNKGFWGQIGSGLKNGTKAALIDPFIDGWDTIAGSWRRAINDVEAVFSGEMSAADAALDMGSIFINNYVGSIVGTVAAPVEAISNLAETPGHLAKGDYEKAAESWSNGAITAALTAAGAKAGTRGRPACLHSFDPATPVLLANGSTKLIGEIQTGDLVLAADTESGEDAPREVVETHTNLDGDLTDLKVEVEGGQVSTLETTQHHPFWSADRSDWVDAKDLRPGERLRTANGSLAVVAAVHSYTGAEVMRDLTVANLHTYYVLAGSTPVLVHNCGVDPATPTGGKGNPLDIRTPSEPGVIGGREYTGHALDRMQRQGIMPSVVENAAQGAPIKGKVPGTTAYYDDANNITVITDTRTGRVVTVDYGKIRQ